MDNTKLVKVDNFKLLEELLFNNLDKKTTATTDKIILGRIIRRRKENPGDPRTEFIVKRYTFSTKEVFIERQEEIKKLCELFNARFYVSVNVKSMKDIAFDMAEAMPKLLRTGHYYYARRMFDNVGDANKGLKAHRLWIYDIDEHELYQPVVNFMKEHDLYDKYVVASVPTINGTHLLVKPHDIRYMNDFKSTVYFEFNEMAISKAVDIKKNAMTLAYYSNELVVGKK